MKPSDTDWLTGQKSLKPGIPLVRAFQLLFFVEHLRTLGCPVGTLLQQAHIPVYALEQPQAPVPLCMARKFIQMAAVREDLPHLGLLVGTGVTLRDFGAYGQLLSHSRNLHDYLINAVHHFRALNSGAYFWFRVTVDQVRVGYHRTGAASGESVQDDLFSLMTTVSLIRQLTRTRWTPTLLRLPCLPSHLLGRLCAEEAIGGIRIVTGAGDPCIVFPAADLHLPMACRPPFPEHRDAGVSQLMPLPVGLDDSLRLLLQHLLREGYPPIEQVAAAAGVGKRSLQRYLSALGLNYSDLVERVRLETAVRLLSTTDESVDAIAYSLGYTDPANFSRAFRRWLGMAPRRFRQQTVAPAGD